MRAAMAADDLLQVTLPHHVDNADVDSVIDAALMTPHNDPPLPLLLSDEALIQCAVPPRRSLVNQLHPST